MHTPAKSTRRLLPLLLVAVGWPALGASSAHAQDFRWAGRLSPGQTLEVRGVNGSIRALPASGAEAVVTAEKRARRSDPESVEIRVVEHEDGVTICAVYPSRRDDRPNECRPGGGHMDTRRNDVEVEFEVRVPAGVELSANTVNGKIEAEGLSSNVSARTVNGGIDISTSGHAEARTVNGSIHAKVGRADWEGDAEFETVNGGITIGLPADAGARVEAATVNGDLDTDFPLTIQGRFGPRRFSGTIGGGGRSLELKTVNGSIQLRRN